MSDSLYEILVESLPDDPMHVEVRGLLFGAAELRLIGDPREPAASGFVMVPRYGLAVGYGAPSVDLLGSLRVAASESGRARDGLKLHLTLECAEAWLAQEGVANLGRNVVQTFQGGEPFERLPSLIQHDARILPDPSEALLATLPSDAAAEFAILKPWPAVACTVALDRIASIAYAFVETETYFDISIDTFQAFRREGHGTSCAAALILHQQERARRPVWIANERSRASLALSNRLGFEEVGQVQAALLE
ncbi:hypothetical protein Poly30_30110 [Planctomycetes bacterium Poly30]|uniref:N-acetyltransferase domain-containing protein n=1 Tax=Saltatorellus ferox TaxID=2528018 RepID=A0A518ETT5_9BACT|nr:hypothetical protein Poly30_30110 [Planctomycetes bacterium Poly30]